MDSDGPLSGVRVLDLSRIVAVPFATMALGEFGADVVKVERAGAGDETRTWGPPFAAGESAYYLSVNRNKRSLALDLTRAEDREIVRRLAVQWADVVVENFRVGTLDRWGIGLDQLREANPRLVTASLSGYPPGDPRPGYDFIAQADTGVMSLIGDPDGEPHKVGYPVADISAGMFVLSGILGALYRRERTGRGQHVGVSIWESQVAVQVNINQSHLITGAAPTRLGNAHPQIAPYETVATQDGVVALACANDRQAHSLVTALGRAELAADPRFATNPDRVANRAALMAEVDAVTVSMTSAELIALLQANDIPCAEIRSTAQVLSSAEAERAGAVVRMEHPTVGALDVVRLPWRFSEDSSRPRRPPPLLGEHDEEIRGLL